MSETQATTRPLELSCEQCRELLSGYVDHEVTGEERAGIEHHLATCTHCAGESAVLVGLKNVVRNWDGVKGSPQFHEQVINQLVRESQIMPSKQFTDAAAKARGEAGSKAPAGIPLADGPTGKQLVLWIVLSAAALAIAALAILYFMRGSSM